YPHATRWPVVCQVSKQPAGTGVSTVPDSTLNRIRCPPFTRVFPKNRCERTASGISPGTKKFFCKNVFHTKATPFNGTEPFLAKFLGEGPNRFFGNQKAPPPGGLAGKLNNFNRGGRACRAPVQLDQHGRCAAMSSAITAYFQLFNKSV